MIRMMIKNPTQLMLYQSSKPINREGEADHDTIVIPMEGIGYEIDPTPTTNYVLQVETERSPEQMDEWLRNEGPNLGFEVHEILTAPGRVSDKIHYSLAGALKEHAGYTQSDAVELENMRRNEVWIARKITDLGQTDRKNMARAHMLRYATFTSAGGVRVLDKAKKQTRV